jgi:hypothetical protein
MYRLSVSYECCAIGAAASLTKFGLGLPLPNTRLELSVGVLCGGSRRRNVGICQAKKRGDHLVVAAPDISSTEFIFKETGKDR